jgi:hypothetical protein
MNIDTEALAAAVRAKNAKLAESTDKITDTRRAVRMLNSIDANERTDLAAIAAVEYLARSLML